MSGSLEQYERFLEHDRTVCPKCGETKRNVEFLWDDGLNIGVAKRCKACRTKCTECTRAKRCPKHEAEYRGPMFPPARFAVRPHAVRRFIERVRPDLRGPAAVFEMLTLALEAEHVQDAPGWLYADNEGRRQYHRGYLRISDDMVFALGDYRTKGVMISTVLTRQMAEEMAALRELQ